MVYSSYVPTLKGKKEFVSPPSCPLFYTQVFRFAICKVREGKRRKQQERQKDKLVLQSGEDEEERGGDYWVSGFSRGGKGCVVKAKRLKIDTNFLL